MIVRLLLLAVWLLNPGRCSHWDENGVVSLGMWGGLNNQRQCVVPSFLLAEKLGYSVLLPHWRLDFLGESGDERGLVPFTYLFKIDKLRALAEQHGVHLYESVHALPDEIVAVCMEQLSRHHPGGDPVAAEGYHWHKTLVNSPPEQRPRAVCMNDLAAIYHGLSISTAVPSPPDVAQLMTPEEVRDAMEPSDLFRAEVDQMMDTIATRFGTKQFVALHLRTELDWVHHCQKAPKLAGDSFRCFMDDDEVQVFLKEDEKLPQGSIILVCSDRQELPDLCNEYQCFRRDDVWMDPHPNITEHLTRETRAFLDYLLALRAVAFFGQMHSTFSSELLNTYHRQGRHARFYNLPCTSFDECRRIPDKFKLYDMQMAGCDHDLSDCLEANKAQLPSRVPPRAVRRRYRRHRIRAAINPGLQQRLAENGTRH